MTLFSIPGTVLFFTICHSLPLWHLKFLLRFCCVFVFGGPPLVPLMQLMGLTISPLAPAVLFEQYRSGTADVVLFEQYRSGTADVVLFEQYRSGPADVVVVCADGLMMVPSSATLRPPSPLATGSIGAHLWLFVRHPLLALIPMLPPPQCVRFDWGCAGRGCGGWDRPDQAGGGPHQ